MENTNSKYGVGHFILVTGTLLLIMALIPYVLLTNDIPFVFVMSVAIFLVSGGASTIMKNRKRIRQDGTSFMGFVTHVLGSLLVLDGAIILIGRWILN